MASAPTDRIGDHVVLAALEGYGREVFLTQREGGQREIIALFDSSEDLAAELDHTLGACIEVADDHVANVVQHFEVDGRHAVVFEGVVGVSLAVLLDHLREKGIWLTDGAALAVGLGFCRGLAAAHRATNEDGKVVPLVHSQMGPHQVFISFEGEVKVLGLGLGPLFQQTRGGGPLPELAAAHVAPEVKAGGKVTARANAFTAGSMLWNLLAREEPPTATPHEPLTKRRPDLSQTLTRAIDNALAPPVIRRATSCADLAKTIERSRMSDLDSLRSVLRAMAAETEDAAFPLESLPPTAPPPWDDEVTNVQIPLNAGVPDFNASFTPPAGSPAAIRRGAGKRVTVPGPPPRDVPPTRVPVLTRPGTAPAGWLSEQPLATSLEALSSSPPHRVSARGGAPLPAEPDDAPAARVSDVPAAANPFDPPPSQPAPIPRRSAPGLAADRGDDVERDTAVLHLDDTGAFVQARPTPDAPPVSTPSPVAAPVAPTGPVTQVTAVVAPPAMPPANPSFLTAPVPHGLPSFPEPQTSRSSVRSMIVGAAAGIALFVAGFFLGRTTAKPTPVADTAPPAASTASPPVTETTTSAIAVAPAPPPEPPVASPSPAPSSSASDTSDEPTAFIEITTSLKDTHLYVDGHHVGPTGQRMAVPCGLHHVRLGTPPPLDGWLSKGKSFVFECGETMPIFLELHYAGRRKN